MPMWVIYATCCVVTGVSLALYTVLPLAAALVILVVAYVNLLGSIS